MRVTDAALRFRPKDLSSGDRLRRGLDRDRTEAPPPTWLTKRCRLERVDQLGRPVIRLTPKTSGGQADIIYLHGGAYVSPMSAPHWWIIAGILARTGARVTVPSYLLAPEHTADEALPAVDAVVEQTLADVGGRPVFLVGDSAGGGMALVQAIRCRDRSGPQPSAVVLYSPWVDFTMTNPAARALEPRDAMLACDGLIAAGRWWAGDRPTSDPMISPINDHLGGLPPLTILQGGRDIFLPDARRLAEKARAAGTDALLEEAPDGFHVYMGAPWTPEARHGLATVARRVAEQDRGAREEATEARE